MVPRCPRGPVGIAALLCRGQTAGGGSIPRWSASKPQVTRRKPVGAVQKKKAPPGGSAVAWMLHWNWSSPIGLRASLLLALSVDCLTVSP